VLAIALMAFAYIAYSNGTWPPRSGNTGATASFTPTSADALNLVAEPAGQPHKDPNNANQLIVPVKITNKILQSASPQGTPTPGAATPTPGPAKVYNATVKVLFYDGAGNTVGSAVGNYANTQGGLEYGQSATFDIVAIGVGDFQSYKLFPDSVWTDKDPGKGPGGATYLMGPVASLSPNPHP
jgi:hypothetical protein